VVYDTPPDPVESTALRREVETRNAPTEIDPEQWDGRNGDPFLDDALLDELIRREERAARLREHILEGNAPPGHRKHVDTTFGPVPLYTDHDGRERIMRDPDAHPRRPDPDSCIPVRAIQHPDKPDRLVVYDPTMPGHPDDQWRTIDRSQIDGWGRLRSVGSLTDTGRGGVSGERVWLLVHEDVPTKEKG
jgi:hypothetical protein